MKKIINILLFIVLVSIVTSCGYDNFDEPESQLTGKIVYNGQSLGLRGTGGNMQVQLYQDGYAFHTAITVYVDQEGVFEAKLFNGTYKLVTKSGNGPWVNNRDTTVVEVKGSTNCTLEVTPYFMISNPSISLNGNAVSASFTIDKIVSTAEISQVLLLVSKTAFVDDGTYIARQKLSDVAVGANTGTLDLSGNTDASKAVQLYGRISVKAKGADQAIYSDVVRLK